MGDLELTEAANTEKMGKTLSIPRKWSKFPEPTLKGIQAVQTDALQVRRAEPFEDKAGPKRPKGALV
jgi:hypothetical protein